MLDKRRACPQFRPNDYAKYITIEPGKRGGKPCVRGVRITANDVLDYLASGMSESESPDEFPELTLRTSEPVSLRSQRWSQANEGTNIC